MNEIAHAAKPPSPAAMALLLVMPVVLILIEGVWDKSYVLLCWAILSAPSYWRSLARW